MLATGIIYIGKSLSVMTLHVLFDCRWAAVNYSSFNLSVWSGIVRLSRHAKIKLHWKRSLQLLAQWSTLMEKTTGFGPFRTSDLSWIVLVCLTNAQSGLLITNHLIWKWHAARVTSLPRHTIPFERWIHTLLPLPPLLLKRGGNIGRARSPSRMTWNAQRVNNPHVLSQLGLLSFLSLHIDAIRSHQFSGRNYWWHENERDSSATARSVSMGV